MSEKVGAKSGSLRSQDWFDDPDKIDMVAYHLESLQANGFALEELQSVKPVIGIAQTGSDIAPCHRHFLGRPTARGKPGERENLTPGLGRGCWKRSGR